MLVNNSSLPRNLVEHLINNVSLEWQPVSLGVVVQLLQCHAVVHVLIAGTEESFHNILGDLKWRVSLVQILGRALIVPSVDNFFHAHGQERFLCFEGGFLHGTAVAFGLFFLLHLKNVVHDVVTFMAVPGLLIIVREVVSSGSTTLGLVS